MQNIARTVIGKLGGASAVARLLNINRTTPYKWTRPKEMGGTGGLIPADHQQDLLDKAREQGIDLRPDDFFYAPSEAGDA